MKRKLLFTILSCVFFTTLSVYSQIGVNTEAPNELTELEITNLLDDNNDIIPKGIMIPRMTEEDRDKMDTTVPNTANSVMIYNIDEDCYNYYSKMNGEWQSLCGKLGKAIFTIDCSSIKVFGEYKDGEPLTPSNYIKLTVNVTKPGSYSITALKDPDTPPDNGYYFSKSDVFLSTGSINLIIPGAGTPLNFTPEGEPGDLIKFYANGIYSGCSTNIIIKDSSVRPRYVMDCSKTLVYGEYYEDERLGAQHYIEVQLNVEPASFGATYEITTNEVDGIKFVGTGTLTANPQTVRLWGEGIPHSNEDKKFYITSNSESSTSSCQATVYIIIPKKRVLSIGFEDYVTYGYNWASVGQGSSISPDPISPDERAGKSNWMFTDQKNFGPTANSIVRYSGFVNNGTVWTANNITIDNDHYIFDRKDIYYNNKDDEFRRDVLGYNGIEPMDIVFIGWTGDAGGRGRWLMTNNQAAVLKEFCEAGGILLVFDECENVIEPTLRAIFDEPNILVSKYPPTNPAGSIYRFENIGDDPVLNGPFGNIAGLTWGEDASDTRWATNVPLEEAVLYSNNKNLQTDMSVAIEGAATSLRHRKLPFLWAGDGGFCSGPPDPVAYNSTIICPFMLAQKTIGGVLYPNYPVKKKAYGSLRFTPKYDVYNSIFAANAFAWAIKRAEQLKRERK